MNSNAPTVSYTRLPRHSGAPAGGSDLSGTMQRAGGIGGLLARSSGYSSGNWTTNNFYFADGNGNITYMLDSGQSMVASYRYDPFGNTISQSGTLADANVYLFSSKEIHVNSGMYYYGFRFYDPNLQRWINKDPLGETADVNLFRFVLNAPLSTVDLFGLADSGPDENPICTCLRAMIRQNGGSDAIWALYMALGCSGRDPLTWDPRFPRVPVTPPAYKPFEPRCNRTGCIAGGPPVHLEPATVLLGSLISDTNPFEQGALVVAGAATAATAGTILVGPGGGASATMTVGRIVITSP